MKRKWRETLIVRLWALRNVFLLWFVKPAILEINDRRAIIRIPLNWRTKRHDIHAMYLGVLCMGADVAAGLISFNMVTRQKLRVSFLFKDIKAEFLKRAEDDVVFTNEEGDAIRQALDRTMATGERELVPIHVTATVPTKLGDEPVAKFELTLSLKRRE